MTTLFRNSLASLLAIVIVSFSTSISAQEIFTAAMEGDLKALKQLIKDGSDVNAREPNLGFTPIAAAALRNQPKAVRLLAKKGGDANAGTADGNTPLHGAVFLGYDKVVKELLRAGADPTKANGQGQDARSTANADWQTTQYIASMLQVQVVEEEVNAGREKAVALIDKELDKLAKSNIWLAVGAGNERYVKRLVRKEKDLNALNPDTQSSLLAMAAGLGNAEIADILIDAGADVNQPNGDGGTPLIIAAFFGREDTVKTLLDHGADKSLANGDGMTALMAAQADMSVVDFVASLLNMTLDYDKVIDGKRAAVDLLSAN